MLSIPSLYLLLNLTCFLRIFPLETVTETKFYSGFKQLHKYLQNFLMTGRILMILFITGSCQIISGSS